jgi:hypothetical protein
LQRFSKVGKLTISHLEQLFIIRSDLLKYLPNNPKFKYLKMDFLFSVIYEVDKIMFKNLMDFRNKEEKKGNLKAYSEFTINIAEEFNAKISSLSELNSNINIRI